MTFSVFLLFSLRLITVYSNLITSFRILFEILISLSIVFLALQETTATVVLSVALVFDYDKGWYNNSSISKILF